VALCAEALTLDAGRPDQCLIYASLRVVMLHGYMLERSAGGQTESGFWM
jgi:hypothetical protein